MPRLETEATRGRMLYSKLSQNEKVQVNDQIKVNHILLHQTNLVALNSIVTLGKNGTKKISRE